jgi:cation:H+ antiporter
MKAFLTMELLETLLLFVGIIAFCALFTNSVEWMGHRFKLSEGAVGSVLAAVGTALPETMVPIVAILSGVFGLGQVSASEGHDIGIGAILGAPFMLGTLALFVTGIAVVGFAAFGKRPLRMTLNENQFLKDMVFFFPAFLLSMAAAWIPQELTWGRYAVGVALLGIYGLYVYKVMNHPVKHDNPVLEAEMEAVEAKEEHHLDPLYFASKQAEPSTKLIMVQTAVALVGIVWMAHAFVDMIHHLSKSWQIPAMLLSLVIVPVATELPEKFNSVLWIGKQKDTLALGNMTGAMVFQSCIPTAVGIAFTPWVLEPITLTSCLITLASAGVISVLIRVCPAQYSAWILCLGGVAYLGFFGYLLQTMQQAGPLAHH